MQVENQGVFGKDVPMVSEVRSLGQKFPDKTMLHVPVTETLAPGTFTSPEYHIVVENSVGVVYEKVGGGACYTGGIL